MGGAHLEHDKSPLNPRSESERWVAHAAREIQSERSVLLAHELRSKRVHDDERNYVRAGTAQPLCTALLPLEDGTTLAECN